MPLTVSTRERSLILGGPDDEPEFYDLAHDPQERENTWATSDGEGALLAEQALSFLEGVRTPSCVRLEDHAQLRHVLIPPSTKPQRRCPDRRRPTRSRLRRRRPQAFRTGIPLPAVDSSKTVQKYSHAAA